MQPIPDRSFGVVPIFMQGGEPLYLLVQHVHGGHWAFPKGHADVGETDTEAALRELREETGLTLTESDLFPRATFVEHYTFERDGRVYAKEVLYFAGQSITRDTTPQIKEVVECRWLEKTSALELLTFSEAKKILTSVDEFVKASLH